jgi:dTDP-4-amino-4,6-dideoxyglucose
VKSEISDLALFGSPPAFAAPLHVGRPNIGDRQAILSAIDEALDERWLSNAGAKLQAFEARLSEQLGGLHCVAVCNATLGLQIVLRALGVEGEVVIPAFTFVATAHAVAWERSVPVFADVETATLCMGGAEAEAQIGPDTAALLGVHLWGRHADLPGLEQLAGERGLPLIFDAAHALGCASEGRPLACFGDAAVLSFHATKVANTFEGGAVVTADADLAERVATMRNFGFVDEDEVVGLGTNAKMSEAGAAMGLASLAALDGFLDHNRRNYAAYAAALGDLSGIELLPFDPPEDANCHHIAATVDPERAGLDRDDLKDILTAENVLARRYFYPGCHRLPPYSATPAGPLPVTERALARCISLPTGSAVGEAEIATIGQLVRLALSDPGAVRGRLHG